LQQRARLSLHIDEARLRPHLRRQQPAKRIRVWTPADVLEVEAEEARQRRDLAAVPSPGDARGVPIVGAAAGVIRGTDPLGELLRRER
jgi:hypothetical protein